MATIGCFKLDKDGYTGTIRTLTVNIKAQIRANDRKNEGSPDFRIFSGKIELGAAWIKHTRGDEPCEFLSVQLDDPAFGGPIHAALFERDGAAYLVWNR